MKKYYYDCPIEAAYMAKNFDVEFLVDGKAVVYDDNSTSPSGKRLRFWYCDENGDIDEACYVEDEEKIYIHPESLPIFEPMEKDIAMFKGEFDNLYGEVRFSGTWARLKDMICGEHHYSRTIERNNKPFITPKQENKHHA